MFSPTYGANQGFGTRRKGALPRGPEARAFRSDSRKEGLEFRSVRYPTAFVCQLIELRLSGTGKHLNEIVAEQLPRYLRAPERRNGLPESRWKLDRLRQPRLPHVRAAFDRLQRLQLVLYTPSAHA